MQFFFLPFHIFFFSYILQLYLRNYLENKIEQKKSNKRIKITIEIFIVNKKENNKFLLQTLNIDDFTHDGAPHLKNLKKRLNIRTRCFVENQYIKQMFSMRNIN